MADGAGYAAADMISVINGAHSLIDHMTIKSAGKIIYDTNNLHKVAFLENVLEFSDGYSISVAAAANANTGFAALRALTQANQNDGNGGAKTVSTIIPLNRYSFFEELEDEMLVPMQLELNLQLQDDNELIFMAKVNKGKSFQDVLKVFSWDDTMKNERFIKKYFD